MNPIQEIFMLTEDIAIATGETTYTAIPTTARYPFYLIGEQFSQDEPNKTAVFGRVYQTVHIYHNDLTRRGTVSKMMNDMITGLRNAKSTKNFHVQIIGISQQIRNDTATGATMLHGILEVSFRFNHKGVK